MKLWIKWKFIGYLIRLWWPSICHIVNGPRTLYCLLRTGFPGTMLCTFCKRRSDSRNLSLGIGLHPEALYLPIKNLCPKKLLFSNKRNKKGEILKSITSIRKLGYQFGDFTIDFFISNHFKFPVRCFNIIYFHEVFYLAASHTNCVCNDRNRKAQFWAWIILVN